MKVIRKNDARVFLEGSEVCREYYKTTKNDFWNFHFSAGDDGGCGLGTSEWRGNFLCTGRRGLLMQSE